jgi:hypothetical protein
MKQLNTTRVFYSVSAPSAIGASFLNRGVFDLLRDAEKEANKYPFFSIVRHEDRSDKRVSNKEIKSKRE